MRMRHRSIGLRVGVLIAVPALSLMLLYAFVASLTLSNALTQARSTLILAGGLGLVALIATVVLSLTLGRGLVRQLRDLRGSVLTLANSTLPGVIDRLRTGEAVNLDEYAPRQFPTRSEIEQVDQAVSVLQHAALQSAADEARLRHGISEVFRNLAGRSQSLLQRQLALIDSMERQATDPDELENLFRIDHLTTRMRRHAEGLIILSGDTPARAWRRPVPLVDVLRAAVAEVEDYTRVRVQCRTSGAVAGHAVADIVHLLAELAENATVFSPPNTPVRMHGESADDGFVIEIEDRGLGISRARLEEINARLANPPPFDPSGSDRLGLFIASQLARRHDILVTLRPSVFGGTTAVVHLPAALVADEDAVMPDRIRPALPGDELQPGRDSALTATGNGHRNSGGFNFGRTSQAGHGARDVAAVTDTPIAGSPVSETAVDQTAAGASLPAAAEPTKLGLPVRVRQSSIAPQLRDAPQDGTSEPGPADGPALPRRSAKQRSTTEPDPADGPALPRRSAKQRDNRSARPAEAELASPEAARTMVSALQRGWQRGRADPLAETARPAAGETDDHDIGEHDED